MISQEYIEQKLFMQWFKNQYPELLINADVGGVWTRNFAQAMKNKMLGHSNGFPDIFIAEPNKQYYGLFIEMKKQKGGRATPEQLLWLKELNNRGYYAVVCMGYEEAKKVTEQYLKLMQSNDFPKNLPD